MSTMNFVDAQGRFIGGFGNGAKPPEGAIDVPSAPADARDIWDGKVWVAFDDPNAYRNERAVAYRDQLGKETGDYIKTLGDVLDALIVEVAALATAANVATPEFSALLTKIQAVKAEFPKP